ncbi:MAG: hypothetical protein JNJ78_20875 [Anaerolineae bacterium]|nr:hypothetical protein [Anaerolineae bacterium]
MMDWNNNQLWLTAGLLCCVVPFIVLLAGFFWLVRSGQRYLTPDVEELRARFEQMKARNPGLTPDQLVQKIINQQALRSGIVGALTSVGGLPTLPFGLTIDLIASSRIQSATLYLISWALDPQGTRSTVPVLNLLQAFRLVEGASVEEIVAAQTQAIGSQVTRRLAVMLAEKAFAKVIPGLGLVIGFVVNYAIAQGVSRVAVHWYKRSLK